MSAQRAIKEAQKKIAEFINVHYKEVTYYIGNRVFLSIKNIDIIRPSKKIDYKMIGPFKIIREIKDNYELDLLKSMSQKHSIFHPSLLRPARTDPLPD